MHSSPETSQLVQVFQELDKEKKGYITQNEFNSYLQHQPRQIPTYIVGEFFNIIPDSKMTQQIFVCYVMGYRLNLEHLAVSRYQMEKQLGKYAAASPPSGPTQVRKNSLRFTVASKKSLENGEKHNIRFSFGFDIKSQSEKFAEIEDILGHKPDDIVGIIKFKVVGAHQQIRQGLQTILQSVKGIAAQMDENLSKFIQLFKISVKVNGNYIYIIVEVGHVFLVDYATFINQFIRSISPDALIQFSAGVQSNYLKQFLKDNGEKKMEDIQVNLGMNIDSQSLKKLKEFLGNQSKFSDKQQQLFVVLLLLFQQLNLQASFTDSQKLFNKLGVGQALTSTKSQFSALKDMMLFQTLEGFIPESKDVIQNIKKFSQGDGQVSINLKNFFIKLQFKVEVQGFFQLF